jgi:hypothetical protein
MPSEDTNFVDVFYISLSIHFNMSWKGWTIRGKTNAVLKSANARLS